MADPVSYPATLPRPVKAQHQPKVRFAGTDLPGKQAFSSRERGYTGTVAVEFFFTATQAEEFYTWWRDTLLEGGLWFNAVWPDIRPGQQVYCFINAPEFRHVQSGAYRVSATVQARGATEEVVDWSICSVDGPQWSAYPIAWPHATGADAEAYLDGHYVVAPVSGGKVLRVWDQGQSSETVNIAAQEWKRMTVVNGRLVLVAGNAGTSAWSAYSDNLGVTWAASANLPAANYWYSLAARSNGTVISLAYASTNVARSTNSGASWSLVSSGVSRNYRDVIYMPEFDRWIAVADNSSQTRISNDDGLTWSNGGSFITGVGFRLGYHNGVLLAGPFPGSSYVNRSTNGGISWTTHSLPFNGVWSGPQHNGSIWVSICGSAGVDGGKFAWSVDGQTWTQGLLPGLYGSSRLRAADTGFYSVDLADQFVLYGTCRPG